ncbi:MAG: hypothetical protein ABIP68_06735 [Ferruginibacter sp.]
MKREDLNEIIRCSLFDEQDTNDVMLQIDRYAAYVWLEGKSIILAKLNQVISDLKDEQYRYPKIRTEDTIKLLEKIKEISEKS